MVCFLKNGELILVNSKEFGNKSTNKGAKLVLALLAGSVFLLAGCGSGTNQAAAISIENVVVSKTGGDQAKKLTETFLQEQRNEVKTLSETFASNFKGAWSLDTSKATDVKGIAVPNLLFNGTPLNKDHSIPDAFSARNVGAVATIFVKGGEDFIRISTSLKRGSGSADAERASDTTLLREHPAYKAIMSGNSYAGTAILYGAVHMTEYTPIKDAGGKVVGIRFVGLDISNNIELLKNKISKS